MHQLLESSETSSLKNLAREMSEGIMVVFFPSSPPPLQKKKIKIKNTILVYVAALWFYVCI